MANSKKTSSAPEGIRLQKFLSLAGIASRRHAEELIEAGRVKISGRVVTEMGVRVIPGKSRVEVDNKPVFYSEERNYILFYKPAECITTLDDPEHRTTVIDLLPKSLPRVFPVGRLDWDTEGLLLLTNDGELAYHLSHPGVKIPRVYHAKVRGEIKENSPELKKLQNGVELDDGYAKPDRVSIIKFTGNNTWLEIELHIGRNRIVRRLCEAIGHPVMKLRRVSFGSLNLDGLELGAFRDLTEYEVAELYGECEIGNMPTVRHKAGVRFARGFDPKERTMPRQTAPSKESIENADAEHSRLNKRPRPSKMKIEIADNGKPTRKTLKRAEAIKAVESTRYAHDEKRSFNASWNDRRDDRRDDRKSFPRDDRRDERKSFPRDDRRDERKSFPRDDRRDERKSFPRDDRRDDRKSFPRDDRRDDRKSFPRDDRRDERKSFPRDDRRDERKSFPRDDRRDERKSFPRDDRRENKREDGKKRPFAGGVKPVRRSSRD